MSKRDRVRTLLIAFSVLVLSRAESQTPQASSPQAPSTFGETVEVRRATIDVVVTAKNGVPVQGLGIGDFELLVDGKPQQITGFEEVDLRRAADVPAVAAADVPVAATAPPPIEANRRRNIILLLDLYSLDGQRRNQAIESLRKFLKDGWSPGDQVLLAV